MPPNPFANSSATQGRPFPVNPNQNVEDPFISSSASRNPHFNGLLAQEPVLNGHVNQAPIGSNSISRGSFGMNPTGHGHGLMPSPMRQAAFLNTRPLQPGGPVQPAGQAHHLDGTTLNGTLANRGISAVSGSPTALPAVQAPPIQGSRPQPNSSHGQSGQPAVVTLQIPGASRMVPRAPLQPFVNKLSVRTGYVNQSSPQSHPFANRNAEGPTTQNQAPMAPPMHHDATSSSPSRGTQPVVSMRSPPRITLHMPPQVPSSSYSHRALDKVNVAQPQHENAQARLHADFTGKYCGPTLQPYSHAIHQAFRRVPPHQHLTCGQDPLGCEKVKAEGIREELCSFYVGGRVEPILPQMEWDQDDKKIFEDMRRAASVKKSPR
ncbi:hypothetical protein P154DRAFT_558749 [Amniculicola lignicola CBS 123094]|uniref:Uncharacterized protein n=1 Tax=Amniculicola lignicola CBS 123094 TaxID=1392246 RepID=A0A6A5X3V3_9PLEO|nr:hypothetical protein P154DRAFT_558749 [Amniculicola lignicola CBS 123094]